MKDDAMRTLSALRTYRLIAGGAILAVAAADTAGSLLGLNWGLSKDLAAAGVGGGLVFILLKLQLIG